VVLVALRNREHRLALLQCEGEHSLGLETVVNHFAIAAAASAMMIGAGTAAVSPAPPPPEAPGVMNPMVGGQAMLSTRDIVDNIASSPEHTVLLSELKATKLGDTLKGKGPYTVFAPTDEAFARMSAATRAGFAGHAGSIVVKGALDSEALLKLINEHGGSARLTTLAGDVLVAQMNGPTNIVLVDEKGETVPISTYDIYDSNGVTHVIDRVLEAD
jgi:uncharacterized surface protein with fasciclin (FAS1) repeats